MLHELVITEADMPPHPVFETTTFAQYSGLAAREGDIVPRPTLRLDARGWGFL